MLFQPHVSAADLPAFLESTIAIGTGKAWSKLLSANRRQVQRNPILKDYVQSRFAIECAMERIVDEVQKTGRWPTEVLNEDSCYGLVAFAAALTQIHSRLSPKAQKVLEGRVRGVLTSKEGVASVAFELIVATDLMHRGWDVTCNDLELGRGFDFLAQSDGLEIEVECKTFSADLGRKIHQADILELARRLHETFLFEARRSRGLFVDVRVPDRLGASSLPSIAQRVGHSIEAGIDVSGGDPCSVSLHPFGVAEMRCSIPGRPSREEMRAFLGERFGLGNSHFYTVVFPPDGISVLCVRSDRPDKVSESIFDNFKEAAERQLTKKRPGIVWGQVLDLLPDELRQLTIETNSATVPTPLGERLQNFFKSDARSHVHSLRLSTPGIVVKIGDHSKCERGPVSIWWNVTHPQASDPRMSTFIQPG